MIVVDASVLSAALIDDGDVGQTARDRLASERLMAPALIDIEVLSAFRSFVASELVTADRARLAVGELADATIGRAPHASLLMRCWELRHNVTPYDAAYVALAELTKSVLLTADGRLARAPGIRCEVEVLVVPPEPIKPPSQ